MDTPFVAALAIILVLCAWLGLRFLHRRRIKHLLQLQDPLHHCWQATQFLDKPTYCNSCTQMCLSGSYCLSCGLCICTESCCLKMARTCKPSATSLMTGRLQHFWVKGNLPLYSQCFKCFAPCGTLPKLADFRCAWCQQTAHEECMEELESQGCSLGPHNTCIIPPSCVTLGLEGWGRGKRYQQLE